jgi:uncharacterized protein YcnI
MRCSGWSSRAIWACSAAAAALALPGIASAHLSIDPAKVVRGQLADLVFSVPNEDDPVPVDHVTLGIPADFDLDDAEAKPGWTQNRTGQAVTWSGGLIPKGQYARFAIRGTAPNKAETVLFNVLVGDRSGKSITYRIGLDVTAHGPRDGGARTLGRAALIVAIAAAGLGLIALFTSLSVWLRPPSDTR